MLSLSLSSFLPPLLLADGEDLIKFPHKTSKQRLYTRRWSRRWRFVCFRSINKYSTFAVAFRSPGGKSWSKMKTKLQSSIVFFPRCCKRNSCILLTRWKTQLGTLTNSAIREVNSTISLVSRISKFCSVNKRWSNTLSFMFWYVESNLQTLTTIIVISEHTHTLTC